ncbi:MAG: hypothetical protein KF817_05795 [Phycisphaeraceae bacterium]|nr:hypothetical protein [Phycisphaeraceae bacterium]
MSARTPGSTVRLERLEIRRMPGIEHPGFVLPAFHPSVTLIVGPNGSGKTTSGRAIEAVIGATERTARGAIAATLRIDDVAWRVEIEGRSASWTVDGRVQPAPDLAAPESAGLHRIALPDLLVPMADGRDPLAERVARAMAGGFDLAAVGRALQVEKRPEGMQRAQRAVEAALRRLRDEQQRADQVDRQVRDRLPVIEREIEAARRAGLDLPRLRRVQSAREDAEHLAALEAARSALGITADQVERVRDSDLETARGLEARVDAADVECRHLADEVARLAQQAIGDGGRNGASAPDPALPARLIEYASRWRDLDDACAGLEREIHQARGRAEEVLRRCPTAGGSPALAGVQIDERVHDLARRAIEIQAELSSAERLAAGLAPGADLERAAARAEALRLGMHDLAAWLAAAPLESGTAPAATGDAADGRRRLRVVLSGAVMSTLLLAIALGVTGGGSWWLACLLPCAWAGVTWWLLRRRSVSLPSGTRADSGEVLRAAAEQRYRGRDLPAPETWQRVAVTALLERLLTESQAVAAARADLAHRRDADARRERATAQAAALDDERRALEPMLGVRLPDGLLGPAWLPAVADAIRRWHAATEEVAGKTRALEDARAARRRVIEAVHGLLEAAGAGAVENVSALEQVTESLRTRLSAAAQHRQQQETLRGAERRLAEARSARDRFWHERGVEPGRFESLEHLIEGARRWRGLSEEIRDLEVRRAALAQELEATGGAALLELDAAALARCIDEAGARQQVYESLVEERERIRAAMDEAGRGHAIADAHRDVDVAMRELETLRAEAVRRAAARVALRWIERLSREATLPGVARRAEALFTRFTAGRYRLALTRSESTRSDPAGGGGAAFCAFDSADGTGKPLDVLSSGERVQLLLAVRLAFLDHEERDRRLPLVLDEVLATSDDERAAAIMAAVQEIVRGGRQVIILTAQQDERAKWRAGLESAGIGCSEVDLGEIRGGEAGRMRPLPAVPVERPRVPAPDAGEDHARYGRRLGIGMLDPWARGGAASQHLWYAIDDPIVLHRVLESGITQIGPFLAYAEVAGAPPAGSDAQTVRRVTAAKDGIEAACTAWRHGRARPITMADLLESGAISRVFEERVSDVLRDLHDDPARLIEAMEARSDERLKGFRTESAEQLRRYLADNGWLPDRSPLSLEEVRLRTRAGVHDAIEAGTLDDAWVDRVVASLPA